MLKKRLLCVALDGLTLPPEASQAWVGWEVCVVAGPREAARVLRAQSFPLGVLFGIANEEAAYDELDNFLRAHWAMQWVGVFDAAPSGSAPARRLVLDHFCDFHTLPLDPARLGHTLGHALGCAALREPAAPAAPRRDMALKGDSAALARLRREIAKVAGASAPVLIWGESGSGKELTAQAIHAHSARAAGPFVPINCGAIPASLVQSELFGHEKGAFTGAARDKRGLIESAAGGTVFLDEIGDLPMELQSNLLRFLQEKTIYRLGSTHSIEVDVRVIAASHVNLQQAVAQGRFREDLFYRLNVLALDVPPLRERKDDMVLLANHFFAQFSSERAPGVKGFSSGALQALKQHNWPGNVRELINRVRRAMVMAEGRLIGPHDLGLEAPLARIDGEALGGVRLRAERDAIDASLHRTGKNVSQAARELGVSRMTLYRLLAKHHISP